MGPARAPAVIAPGALAHDCTALAQAGRTPTAGVRQMEAHRFELRLVTLGMIAATALVVVLAWQLRSARERSAGLTEQVLSLRPGSYLPLFGIASLDGDELRFRQDESGVHVFLVFSTRCPYSQRTLPAWKVLDGELGSALGVRVLGVSVDSANMTKAYMEANEVPYETALLLDRRLKDVYRFHAVPQTIVVDSSGTVVYSRLGVLEQGSSTDSVIVFVRALIGRSGIRDLSADRSP